MMISTILLVFGLFMINNYKVDGLICPKVEPAHNFEADKTSGSWFVVAEHTNTYTSHLDCLHCNFTINGVDVHGYYEGIQKANNEHIRYELKSTLVADGTFRVDYVQDHVHQDLTVYILYADYDDCTVHYTCKEELNLLYTWTLCRSPKPQEASVKKAHEIMDKFEIPWDDFDKVNQDNCPSI